MEEFIAYIKSLIAEKGLTDEKSINEAIDEACDKYGVTLSDDERQKIVDLLLKITSLGIDLSGLVDYAASLYNSFKMEEALPESLHLLVISLEISLVRLGSSSKICLNTGVLTYELPLVGWCYGFSQVMLIACQQSV